MVSRFVTLDFEAASWQVQACLTEPDERVATLLSHGRLRISGCRCVRMSPLCITYASKLHVGFLGARALGPGPAASANNTMLIAALELALSAVSSTLHFTIPSSSEMEVSECCKAWWVNVARLGGPEMHLSIDHAVMPPSGCMRSELGPSQMS